MAEQHAQHGQHRGLAEQHGQQALHHAAEGVKGPSGSQVLAVATLFPVGGILLALSGVTLTGSVVGLAICTPLFVIFSPVLVPAVLVVGLAVLGFLASGAFGLTALTALSWIANYLRGAQQRVPEQMEYAKRRMAEAAQQVGHRTKDVGQRIENRSQEAARS